MGAIILCYHKVGRASDEGRWLNVSPERLLSHVQLFVRRRFTFVTAGQLSNSWPERCVCFTFDDAYRSALEHAPRIFARYDKVATFYAVSERVGAQSDWDGDKARPLADWELLQSAQAAGHEIGNHTANHAHMAELSSEEQHREIVKCHTRLVASGLRPQSVCYPYGSHDERCRTEIERAGYKVGLVLGKKIASESDDRLALPRVIAAYSDSVTKLLYKIYVRPKLRGRMEAEGELSAR